MVRSRTKGVGDSKERGVSEIFSREGRANEKPVKVLNFEALRCTEVAIR